MTEIRTSWTEALGVSQDERGQDHLSLASVSQNIYDQVTPGFTTLTNRARYYALYCWILHDYYSGGYEREDLDTFLRRREYAFALACVSHNHDPGSLGEEAVAGVRASRRRWRAGVDPLDLSKHPIKGKWGGYGNYRNAMQRIGLLRLSETQDSLTESSAGAPTGRVLAEAFQSIIEDTTYFKKYRDKYLVPRAVIEEYGQVACTCQMRDALDGEVLRRALLQPDPPVSDPGLSGMHLARSRTLSLIFDAINNCGGERMDDMAWRNLVFYRSFSDGRSYEPPEGLAETTLVWRMSQQRELHVYALTSLWEDFLWWLEEYGPVALEEWIHVLDSEADLSRAGARFGLVPKLGRPSQVTVGQLLDTVAASAGVGGAFNLSLTQRICERIGRDSNSSETMLRAARDSDDLPGFGDYVATALWLSLVLYARTRHWASEGGSTAAYITKMGDSRQWSVASYFVEIERKREDTAIEFLAWIYQNLVRQHLTVGLGKLPLDTFRLLYEDGLLHYRAPDWPDFSADRYDQMLNICRDLGWVQETGSIFRLTPLGEKDQAQALAALA
jgi:hypothetical protein